MPERLRIMETWPFKSLKIVTDIADAFGATEYVRSDVAELRLAEAEKEHEELLRYRAGATKLQNYIDVLEKDRDGLVFGVRNIILGYTFVTPTAGRCREVVDIATRILREHERREDERRKDGK